MMGYDGSAAPLRSPSLFEGLSETEMAAVVAGLEARRVPRGTVLLAEGDIPTELLYLEAGTAEVSITDTLGKRHVMAQVGPGSTLGEMSLFTGEPASATVRAVTDLRLLAGDAAAFDRIASAHPRLYRNLGAILSHRLARTNRRVVGDEGATITLIDRGAPPLLGYALACSVAWHTRTPTAIVQISDGEPAGDLARLAGEQQISSRDLGPMQRLPEQPCARLILLPREDASEPGHLAALAERLQQRYRHVLVQIPDGTTHGLTARSLIIQGPRRHAGESANATATEGRGYGAPGRYLVQGWADSDLWRPDRSGVLRVPPLVPSDEEGLRRGVLQPTTAAGKALGWVSRELAGLQVGLALGAGSLRGYAHMGVLKVLERLGVPVDYLAGTSVGAPVAALYSMGVNPDAVTQIFDTLARKVFVPQFPLRGLLSPAGLRAGFRSLGGDRQIEDLPIPLAVSAADILTGQEVVFREGLLWPAVLASVLIPGVYTPLRLGPHVLVDGGVLNPVPSSLVVEMGADVVIAVRLGGGPATEQIDLRSEQGGGPVPTVIQTLTRSIELMQSKISATSVGAATIQITPTFEVDVGGLRRFGAGKQYIEAGMEEAERAIPRIAAALPWVDAAEL